MTFYSELLENILTEMINIIFRSVASEVNDFLWEKFFE